jgi:hypothetical protein
MLLLSLPACVMHDSEAKEHVQEVGAQTNDPGDGVVDDTSVAHGCRSLIFEEIVYAGPYAGEEGAVLLVDR